MTSLSQEERAKFAAYCRQSVIDLTQIIDQMEKISVPVEIMKRQKSARLAYAIVGSELLSTETMSTES